jgi:UDP-N-acetylmuramate: L-alanyl-gamma-D-glutamyl-meso-diaminopimelate ligase
MGAVTFAKNHNMRVHFIAIGGSAMHNLALALHQKGYQVSGSDDQIFEPSLGRLKRAGLCPAEMGWFPEKITSDLDAIILGMHARADNPELQKAQELGLKVYSYPEYLFNETQHQTRVVVAGSHGKTTITAMVLHVLHYHQREEDFMVGAQLAGFETMVRLSGTSEFAIFEGDEYLSSPIDLRPKFHLYKPNITLISGIAWDHINVFPTFENYLAQFEAYLDMVEPGGAVVYNATDPEVVRLVTACKNPIKKFPYHLPEHHIIKGETFIETPEGAVPLQIFGNHNLLNLEGARWLCNQIGVDDAAFYEAITSFKGANNRLEQLAHQNGSTVFKDFAHAPSKVSATVAAVKQQFCATPVVACLELHTFSSLNANFLNQYAGALDAADEAIVFFSKKALENKRLPDISADQVAKAFKRSDIRVVTNRADLEVLLNGIPQRPAVLLLMSSGNYEGLPMQEFASQWVEK